LFEGDVVAFDDVAVQADGLAVLWEAWVAQYHPDACFRLDLLCVRYSLRLVKVRVRVRGRVRVRVRVKG
jgi:hypothetical protein